MVEHLIATEVSKQMDHPVVQRIVLVVGHRVRVPGVKDPVSESVRPTEDEGVAVGQGGGDLADEERLPRLRDAEVEVVVPGDEAAVAHGAKRRPEGGPAGRGAIQYT